MPTDYEIILPLDDDEQVDPIDMGDAEAAAFLKEVEVVFQDKKENYVEFLGVTRDFVCYLIDIAGLLKKVKTLFKGHTDLVLGFNNFLPDGYQIILPLADDELGHQLAIKDALAFLNPKEYHGDHETTKYHGDHETTKYHGNHKTTGKQVQKVAENFQLPWDVLDIIFKTLDFDDLFQFACVCKNLREFHKIYWRNFMASQEPLLIKMSSYVKKSFSFINIPNNTVYHSKVINCFWHFAYSGSSSGYLIMTGNNNSFMLMNPFTRRKKVINTSVFKVNFSYFAYRVLLAFGKGSTREFVLVVLCKSSKSLHVYQSRNFGWVTYSRMGYPWIIVDFVVLHNTIYVVTDKANIGVLSLNSVNIKFLELKSTPTSVTSSSQLRLVTCDGQLLVVHTMPNVVFNVYKIDFSTMNYVKLKTLDDIALFYAPEGNCYALSNPNRWGYESNSLYVINLSSTKCKVYLGNDNKMPKYIRPNTRQTLPSGRPYLLDWCFRHLHYEVDYSLVE